jgi:hypothetical protein
MSTVRRGQSVYLLNNTTMIAHDTCCTRSVLHGHNRTTFNWSGVLTTCRPSGQPAGSSDLCLFNRIGGC